MRIIRSYDSHYSRLIKIIQIQQFKKDPFPDKPGFQSQQPLAGTLKESIAMADLVGTWDNGGANVTTYVDSSSGDYSGTDTTFFYRELHDQA